MPTLRNDGSLYQASGRGRELQHWPAGDQREVSDDQAAHLLTRGTFTVVAAPVVRAPAVVVPVAKDSAPKKKRRRKKAE